MKTRAVGYRVYKCKTISGRKRREADFMKPQWRWSTASCCDTDQVTWGQKQIKLKSCKHRLCRFLADVQRLVWLASVSVFTWVSVTKRVWTSFKGTREDVVQIGFDVLITTAIETLTSCEGQTGQRNGKTSQMLICYSFFFFFFERPDANLSEMFWKWFFP